MSRNRKILSKITVGAILAALSVVIRLIIDPYIAPKGLGTPFYGIPLMLAGIYLGPIYALIVGFIADLAMGTALGGYIPLFMFSSISWALIPSLFTKEPKGIKWYFIVYLTYAIAFGFNTLAMLQLGWKATALANIYLRAGLIPVFGFVNASVSIRLHRRLKDIIPTHLYDMELRTKISE